MPFTDSKLLNIPLLQWFPRVYTRTTMVLIYSLQESNVSRQFLTLSIRLSQDFRLLYLNATMLVCHSFMDANSAWSFKSSKYSIKLQQQQCLGVYVMYYAIFPSSSDTGNASTLAHRIAHIAKIRNFQILWKKCGHARSLFLKVTFYLPEQW